MRITIWWVNLVCIPTRKTRTRRRVRRYSSCCTKSGMHGVGWFARSCTFPARSVLELVRPHMLGEHMMYMHSDVVIEASERKGGATLETEVELAIESLKELSERSADPP